MDIVEKNRIHRIPKTSTNYTKEDSGIKFYEFGTTEGIIAGVVMAALLTLIQVTGAGDNLLLQFATNGVLLAVMAYALNKYHDHLPEGNMFKDGMLMGLYISLVTAGVLAIANLALALVTPFGGFSLFKMSGSSFGDITLISAGIFMVTLVNGLIITFICLQFLKDKSSS